MQLSALPSRLRRSLSILPNITRPGKFGASFGAATTLTRRRSKRSWPVSLVFAKRRAAGGVRLIEGLRRAGIERPIVSLELERVMPALRADRLGHFRVAMQRVAGDDTAFQIKAFQRFQRRFDLIAVVARPRAEGKTRLSVPHADHQRRHEGAATLIAAPQPFAVDGDDARRLTKPQAFAQRFGEGHEGAGHLVRVEQAKQARETVVARRPMRQIDDLGKARLIALQKSAMSTQLFAPHKVAIKAMNSIDAQSCRALTSRGSRTSRRMAINVSTEAPRIKRPSQESLFTLHAIPE